MHQKDKLITPYEIKITFIWLLHIMKFDFWFNQTSNQFSLNCLTLLISGMIHRIVRIMWCNSNRFAHRISSIIWSWFIYWCSHLQWTSILFPFITYYYKNLVLTFLFLTVFCKRDNIFVSFSKNELILSLFIFI